MKSICAFVTVLVFVRAEKRSDFGIFGGQPESGFLPILAHHNDQNIKSLSMTRKMPISFPFNFDNKVTFDKPHLATFSRPHTNCPEKKSPQHITVEKHVLVPVKIPIMKPYPIYVEKKIPYFVYRPYPLNIEKPLTYTKEENQMAFYPEKSSSKPNHSAHQTDIASTSPYQFKLSQDALYAGERFKTQDFLKEGTEGSEYFFGDFFNKGFQQDVSGGLFSDQLGKHKGARELSTNFKQIYL